MSNTQIKPAIKIGKCPVISSVFKRDYQLYILAAPAMIYFIIFNFLPMYGVQIAFKDFYAGLGIFGSPWVGFQNFMDFFNAPPFWDLIKNTVGISLLSLLWGFPIPIILALLLNQLKNEKYKNIIQTVTYAPNFISVVVLVGIINIFLSSNGLFNNIIIMLGGDKVDFLGDPNFFKTIYIASGIWQSAGWSSIIYLAALSSVSTDLYEAARIDGANRWHLIWHIDIPCLLPTIMMMFILAFGGMMNVGFQKIFLMQNPLNLSATEVISTYVYKQGLINAQYSYSAAIGLFNTIINIILMVTVNKISKKVTETSLW